MAPLELVEPDDEVYADYAGRFSGFNTAQSGYRLETFSFVQRQDQKIVAGGRGHVYLGALEVRGLWVDQTLRGSGLGSRLLTAIETHARGRGARKAMLYTYSWQAEAFYEKHGYEIYARFDFPDGPYRVDMKKTL